MKRILSIILFITSLLVLGFVLHGCSQRTYQQRGYSLNHSHPKDMTEQWKNQHDQKVIFTAMVFTIIGLGFFIHQSQLLK